MEKKKIVALCATMDTKAEEARLLQKELESYGIEGKLIDLSLRGESPPDVFLSAQDLAGDQFSRMQQTVSRLEASRYMEQGLSCALHTLLESGMLDGVMGIGGGGGASMICHALVGLPFGMPKIVLTPSAVGDTTPFTCGEDILLVNPVVDIQSQNSLIRYGFRQAAAMMNALLSLERFQPAPAERAVAVTSFGVTTPCVKRCVEWLEKEGYTPYVFTARGMAGGRLLERMIGENRFAAVLDITTSEVIDEIAGGIYAVPGCQRLTGAAKSGIPYVIAPGALEMVNLTAGMEQQPGRKGRVFYAHTEKMIKMRANRQEMEQAGELFAERLGKSEGNVCLCIPGKGFSEVNREGRAFFDPDADRGFVETVRRKLPGQVKIVEAPLHINDAAFAELLIEQLGTLLRGGKR